LQHVHFIGIGGYGMSAIAKVMLEMGYVVSGSDLVQSALTDQLAAIGAKIYIGHVAEQAEGADIIVYSTALNQDNVEIQWANQQNIPVIHRSEMLARLMNDKNGIAIAGAHGKTTTSSMIALVMHHCEWDPTFIIGGVISNLGTNAKAGAGDFLIAEADESDSTFLAYHPNLAIVLNIEADHLENYEGDFSKLKQAYAQFLSHVRTGGNAVVCQDDAHLQEMIPHLQSNVITYGIEQAADYMAKNIVLDDRKLTFDAYFHGECLGRVDLSVPGKHNVYNALAALVTCMESGLTFRQFAESILQFHGAKRRFQVLGEEDGIVVVDDYAHHPTEIEATIRAAKAMNKRIIAVFQPQRYTRTFFLFTQFSKAFSEADEVVITDIYSPAGEQQIEGISSAKLTELIRTNSNPNVKYIASRDQVQAYLIDHVQSGDLVITMGAGDIWKAAEGLSKALKKRRVAL